eukprot:gene5746-6650_t
MDQVKLHNTAKDLWMVIDDKVYDLTEFLDEHPGGDILLEGAGKDATYLFEEIFKLLHWSVGNDEHRKRRLRVAKLTPSTLRSRIFISRECASKVKTGCIGEMTCAGESNSGRPLVQCLCIDARTSKNRGQASQSLRFIFPSNSRSVDRQQSFDRPLPYCCIVRDLETADMPC